MSIQRTLQELGLATTATTKIFRKGTRDNPNVEVLRDDISGVIFIKDFYVGEEEYESGEYRQAKASKEGKKSAIKNYERASDCARRKKDFCQFYAGKDIADFGCGYGDFLVETRDLTNYSVGIELQLDAIQELRAVGIRCEKSLEKIQNQSIDTFFLFHSFEHLPDPLTALRQIKNKLKRKGRIVIEVPHANDFLISTLREQSFIEFTLWSQHLILHTQNSLTRFLECSGFRNILVKGVQRYPLSNHLNWIGGGGPGGHQSNLSLLDTEALTEAYENALAAAGATDTLVAVADAG